MTHGSEKFYDRFTFLYPLVDIFLKPQKKKFFRTINSYPDGRLLEIGIGNGSDLKYYTRHDVTGIDTSKSMLARARRHLRSNMRLLQMNGEDLSFTDNEFDYVILSHVIAVVENPERLLEEAHRVLKPGGKVFILNHFTPDNWLKYVDKTFQRMSALLHLKSVFQISGLRQTEQFKLREVRNAGPFSYFKILIYEKKV